MARVFISHSTADRDFVERDLLPLLQQNGVEPWYAPQAIQSASQWERTIVSGLESCEWFLLVMSPRSARSEWVRAEVNWAIGKRTGKIVPLLLESCDSVAFHLWLPLIQHIDLRADRVEGSRRLLAIWGIKSPPRDEPKAVAPRVDTPRDEPRVVVPRVDTPRTTSTMEDLKRRFAEEVRLRAFDERLIDQAEEREILQIAIQWGITIDSARTALRQTCESQGYVLVSSLARAVKELLVLDGPKGITADRYNDAVSLCTQETQGRLEAAKCKRLVLQVIDDNKLPVRKGLFSNWYTKERHALGMT